MILDRYNEFASEQDLGSQAVGSVASTNVVDLNAEGDAKTEEPFLHILCKEDVASAGAATVQFALQTDSVEAFSSPTTLWQSSAIAKATLVDGYWVARLRLPQGCERYLRVYYTVGTADLTAGKFDAFLSWDDQDVTFPNAT